METAQPMDHSDDISRFMREMGRKGAVKRWAATGEDARKAHGAMLAKARKRAKRLKQKALADARK